MKNFIAIIFIFILSTGNLFAATGDVYRRPRSSIGAYSDQTHTTTFFMGLYSVSTDEVEANMNDSELPPGSTFVVSRFHAEVRNAPGASASWQVVLRRNAASTDIACTISETSTECNDIVDSVTFVSGDNLTVAFTETGSASNDFTSAWSALLK